ncbi:MAG: hypothetical protein HKN20_12315 [Gemmatimonadetes bacterium]|nr:hypothetical protein [Gemmatimonadota bacterium]
MRNSLILLSLLIALAAAGCRDSGKSASAPAAAAPGKPATAEDAAVEGAAPPKRTGPVPTTIDPEKAEKLTTGHEGERLLAKYELLVERIRKERKEKVYNSIRMIVNGLKPIASEHHELYEAGKIDSLTHDSFVKLGVFLMSHHIMAEEDPHGLQAGVIADSIRARIKRGPEGTPAAPDSAPPR